LRSVKLSSIKLRALKLSSVKEFVEVEFSKAEILSGPGNETRVVGFSVQYSKEIGRQIVKIFYDEIYHCTLN